MDFCFPQTDNNLLLDNKDGVIGVTLLSGVNM